tara:strand:+ start:330 stop:620 length:291 start_codon:yes stop_codon:yes gene_type:complete
METIIKEKKTANLNKYMSEYMKKKYNENPTQQRNYKNSLNIRKKYIIDNKVWDQYKENLYAVVTLKETIDTLPPGVFEKFLMEYKTLEFLKKEIMI